MIHVASCMINKILQMNMPANQAFSFLKLPPEVRIMVYRYAFSNLGVLRSAAEIASTNKAYLDEVRSYPTLLTFVNECWFYRFGSLHPYRTHGEQDFIVQLSNHDAVAILRTCHLVCREAAPILYETAAFHQSIRIEHTDLPVSHHFQCIRYLSIDLSDASPRRLTFEELSNYEIEYEIADSLVSIAERYTSLKSLTLHIITTGGVDKILNSQFSCKVSPKLVSSLECLSVIAPTTTRSMERLCQLIAPVQGWKIGRSRQWPFRWPGLTVPLAQLETIREVTDKSSFGDYRTRRDVVCVHIATLRLE